MSLYLSILLAIVLTLIGAALAIRGQRGHGRWRNRERLIFVRNKTRF